MNNTKANIDLAKLREERALIVLFSSKQIEVIRKVLNLGKLSKVENEVYSRTVRPKLNAIIDICQLAIVTRSKE